MKHGAIIGRDVVSLGKTHHIMRSWRSEGGVGTTLCGLKVAIGFGVDGVWENVPTGKWEVEKDCGTCLRVLGPRQRRKLKATEMSTYSGYDSIH